MSTVPEPPLPPTDSELLARWLEQQDRIALETLINRHATLVWGVCVRVLGRQCDAEDAFQATFVVLIKRAGKIRQHRSLSAWLHGVACRVSLRLLDQNRRIRVGTDELPEPQQSEPGPLEQIARRSDEEILDEELNNLPDQYRTALVLRYLEARTAAEIAQLLQLSVTAVEARLKRARASLRQRLIRRGITLATFASILATTPALPAVAGSGLTTTTLAAVLSASSGTAGSQLLAHQLAHWEIARMSLSTPKLLALLASTLLAAGFGWYGLKNTALAESPPPAGSSPLSSIAAGQPMPAVPAPVAVNHPLLAPAAPAVAEQPVPQTSPEAALENRLDQQVEQLHLAGGKVGDVLSELARQQGLPLRLDMHTLELFGIPTDAALPEVQVSGQPLRSVLEEILRQVQMDYIIQDNLILVTTPEKAHAHIVHTIYPTAELGIPPQVLVNILYTTVATNSWEGRDVEPEKMNRILKQVFGGGERPADLVGFVADLSKLNAEQLKSKLNAEQLKAYQQYQQLSRYYQMNRAKQISTLHYKKLNARKQPLLVAQNQKEHRKIRQLLAKLNEDHPRSSRLLETINTPLEKLEWPAGTLQQAVDVLAKKTGLNFTIDPQGSLDGSDLRQLTVQALEISQTSPRTVLETLLEPQELGWLETEEGVLITNRNRVNSQVERRIYRLEYLENAPESQFLASMLIRMVPNDGPGRPDIIPLEGETPRLLITASQPYHRRINDLLQKFDNYQQAE